MGDLHGSVLFQSECPFLVIITDDRFDLHSIALNISRPLWKMDNQTTFPTVVFNILRMRDVIRGWGVGPRFLHQIFLCDVKHISSTERLLEVDLRNFKTSILKSWIRNVCCLSLFDCLDTVFVMVRSTEDKLFSKKGVLWIATLKVE